MGAATVSAGIAYGARVRPPVVIFASMPDGFFNACTSLSVFRACASAHSSTDGALVVTLNNATISFGVALTWAVPVTEMRREASAPVGPFASIAP